MKNINTYAVRHAIAVGVAIVLAVLLNEYSYSQEGWMVLGAFLVTQTTRGTPLRQGLIFFITINASILFSAFLLMYVQNVLMLNLILGAIFISTAFLNYLYQPNQHNTFYCLLYLAIIMLVATQLPMKSTTYLHDRVLDTAIGSVLGIICAQWILPVRLTKEFAAGIVPLLTSLSDYVNAWSNYFAKEGQQLKLVNEKKIMLEETLQEHKGIYPEWVYEVGFNPGLRSGFRYFLVNIERVVEICFSLDYWGNEIGEENLPENFAQAVALTMQKNQELLNILLTYFSIKQIAATQSDFTSDIASLETVLQQFVPDNLEALDIADSFLLLTAITRDLKDMRGLLLQLVMSLPAPETALAS